MVDTENLLQEYEVGKMNIPKKVFQSLKGGPGQPKAVQTLPLEMGNTTGTQTESTTPATPEERSESPGVPVLESSPSVWDTQRTPGGRSVVSRPQSLKLSEISSVTSSSERTESPMPLPSEGSPESQVEEWLMTPGKFRRSEAEVEHEKTPTKETPGTAPIETLEVTIVQENLKKVTEQTEVEKTLVGYKVPLKEESRAVKRIAGSEGEAPTCKTPTEETPMITSGPSLLEVVYRKQGDFELKTLDSRVTTKEDQSRGWKAHVPSIYYTEPRSAASRHVIPATVDPADAPQWVVTLIKRMSERKPEEHPYLPVDKDKENSSQMPGRTDAWQSHTRGYHSFTKLTLDRMKRARVMVVLDSSVRPVPEHNYLLEDVVQLVMPGSTLRQMHSVMDYIVKHVATPKVLVFCNIIDDLAEKRILKELLESRPRSMARALQSLLEDMTLVQQRIQETTRGATLVAFASPPGFAHWGRKPLQMLVYALWEMSKFDRRDAREEIVYHFRICAPNLRVHPESLRLAELANPAFFAEISKFLQRNFFAGEAANLTKDDAMCFDFGMWIAERIAQDNQGWLASTAMRQRLDDNFALTPARTGVNTVKSMVNVGMKKLQRVKQGVKVAALPEARRIFTKDRPKGIKLIMAYLLNLAQEMHQEGRTYREWTLVGRRSLEFFAKEQKLETMELIHLLGWTWSPVITAKVYQLDPEAGSSLPGILARLTLAEVMALFVTFGPEEFAAGPIRMFELLIGESTDINTFLTFRAVCNDHYAALRELIRLCSKKASKREIDAAIHAREDALNQWVFSTLLHVSGIFEERTKLSQDSSSQAFWLRC